MAKTMATPELFVSISEVAESLGLSEMTIRRLIAEGELEAVAPRPRCIRISQSSLEKFLKRKAIPTRSNRQQREAEGGASQC